MDSMTDTHQQDEQTIHDDSADGVVERVLRNADQRAASSIFAPAQAIQTRSIDEQGWDGDGEQYDREDRAALRRVGGLSTELEDVTEVEYRQLRLERVVLIGVYPQGDATDAEKDAARTKLEKRFAYVNEQLAGKEYLLGSFSIADAYLYTIARWSMKTTITFAELPELAAFMTRMEGRAGVATALEEEGLGAFGA